MKYSVSNNGVAIHITDHRFTTTSNGFHIPTYGYVLATGRNASNWLRRRQPVIFDPVFLSVLESSPGKVFGIIDQKHILTVIQDSYFVCDCIDGPYLDALALDEPDKHSQNCPLSVDVERS